MYASISVGIDKKRETAHFIAPFLFLEQWFQLKSKLGADESQIPPASSPDLFLLEKKAEYLPAFSLTWFVNWTPILNGERVVTQVDSSRNDNTTDFEVPEFKSRPPLPRNLNLLLA